MTQNKPQHGGTLRLHGPAELDDIDPVRADRPPMTQLVRLFARQLFTYRPDTDLRNQRAVEPVADLAADVPSIYNAGVGASHTSYTVHLRSGVYWDTDPPREVTAHDVVRGFKRMCNPVARPAALPYFTSTIRGMGRYCADFTEAIACRAPTATDLAAFQNSHDIPGVFTLDDETLVFELERPALDFANMLALPCTAAAPVEYDTVLPGSAGFRREVRSNGPYRIAWHTPGKAMRLEPNPAWKHESDPVRHQHLTAIEVTRPFSGAQQTAERIRGNHADLPWTTALGGPAPLDRASPRYRAAYSLGAYLAFNLRSPNCDGATGKVGVRRAIAYALDKAAMAEAVDSPDRGKHVRPAGSIVPPGNDGHQELDLYRTPGDGGDPEKCRALLAEAGYPDGLTLTALYSDHDTGPDIAHRYATDLEKAGITVRLVHLDPPSIRRLLDDPERAAAGEWDLTALSWAPDWQRGNGRVFLQPMFQSEPARGGGNHGGHHDPEVDALITRALDDSADPRLEKAGWHAVEHRVLRDAAIVPLLFEAPTNVRLRGSRVRGANAMPAFEHTDDLASLWLGPPD